MGINLVPDVGAPLVVTGVNIMANQSVSEIMGQPISDVASYVMAGGGYLGAYMGWGGRNNDFVKNVGIAAAPLAFEKLYNALKGGTTAARPVMRRVSRYPARATETDFQGVRLNSRVRGGILV